MRAGWTALVPIKPAAERKTRLRAVLRPDEIAELTDRMLRHVVGVLTSVDEIGEVIVLSPELPAGMDALWWREAGRGGLNRGLESIASCRPERLLVVHADLPMLAPGDVEAMIAGARGGCAIGPDQRGTGTNSLALERAAGRTLAFGPGSLLRHRKAMPDATVVHRPGIAFDVDLPDDLETVSGMGLTDQV